MVTLFDFALTAPFSNSTTDTAVLHFDTDFNQIYGDIIFNHIMSLDATQNYTA